MPRKPTSIFLMAETPSTTQSAGMPATNLQAWRIQLEDKESTEQAVERHYRTQPIGTKLYVIEDTKVQGYDVGMKLEAIDDLRLDTGQADEE